MKMWNEKIQELGALIWERAQTLRETLTSEDLKSKLIEKAIVATDITRAKLDELAHRNKTAASKSKRAAKKKMATEVAETEA